VTRLVLAVISGLVTAQAFPTHQGWWWAVLGVALLSATVMGSRWRLALLLGLGHGLGFFLPTLSWAGVYVGDLPWVALSTLEALYLALMCALTTVVQRPFLSTRLRALAYAVVPLAWVLQEWARSTTPFGGFPWARLAFSQADSPLAPLARFAGAPGVTFAVAALGALTHAALVGASHRIGRPRPLGLAPAYRILGAVLAVAALAPLGVAMTTTLPTDGKHASVLFVQGNVPKAGLDFNAQRRAVLDNHVRATVGATKGEGTPPSLVVWPENSSDIDPIVNLDAKAQIQLAVDTAKAPVLVGAVLDGPGQFVSNASLFYRPGVATPERYVKQHPVPFAEYIPYRSFFRRFSDKVDLVTRDFTSGHAPGGFQVPVSGGTSYWIIPTICFEVAYDDLMRDSTMQPGRSDSILAVQTNNATFGYTAESEQQFAISRLRAIEHGRSVVHVSTVGVSGFINPDGTFTDKTTLFTQASRLGTPVVRDEITPSDRIGALPEYVTALAWLALLALGLWLPRRPAKVVVPPTAARKERIGV
jgi:apolipoprotein N-acyltransferase